MLRFLLKCEHVLSRFQPFRKTNSGTRGVWVYEIGTSPLFSSITPGLMTSEVTSEEMTDTETAAPVTETSASQTFTPFVFYDESQTPEQIPFTSSVTEEPVSSTEDQSESHYLRPRRPPLSPRQPQNPEIVDVDEEDLKVNGEREFVHSVFFNYFYVDSSYNCTQ